MNDYYLGKLRNDMDGLSCTVIWNQRANDGFRFLATALLHAFREAGDLTAAAILGSHRLFVETREMRWYIVDFATQSDVSTGLRQARAAGWASVLDYDTALEAVVPLGTGSFLVPPEKVPPFDGRVGLEIAHQLGEEKNQPALQFIGLLVGFLGESLCREFARKTKDRVHPELIRRADGSPRTEGGIFFQTVEREMPRKLFLWLQSLNNTGMRSIQF
jgi:hypothetical protein